jgi:hypothetical protein
MNDLIDTEAIAQLLQCTRKHVADRLVHRPDFPAPAVNVSRKLRRWEREAILAWARQPSRAAMSAGVTR